MRTESFHSSAAPTISLPHPDHRRIERLWRGALNRFLLLPLGAAIAVAWANAAPEAYFRFAHASAFVVNEIAMAFFLGLVAQELFEALMPGGELRRWRYVGGAVIAAAGGLAGSVFAFWMFIGASHELVLGAGWPVVAAVDLAAGYYVIRLIYPRRHSVTTFVLLTAVITDVVVIAIVTLQAPDFNVRPAGLLVILAAIAGAAELRRRRVASFWPYWLVCGTASWFGSYWLGIHPAFALVPIVPFLPHDARRAEVFADRVDRHPIHVIEHRWNGVAQMALFLFGLVNAGVILKQVDTGTWAVVVGAVLGRPAGILLALAMAAAIGIGLPRTMQWRDVAVAALATTSGFTFALFVGTIVLPVGAVAGQMTVGALLTAGGALSCIGAAWLMHAGRFKLRTGSPS